MVVDLIYNFYITWGKRQDSLNQKFEALNKEHKLLLEKYSELNSKINITLQTVEDIKEDQVIIRKNIDYIREEKNITLSAQEVEHHQIDKESEKHIIEIKNLVKEIKTIILS